VTRTRKQSIKPAAKQAEVQQPVKPFRKQSIKPTAKRVKEKA